MLQMWHEKNESGSKEVAEKLPLYHTEVQTSALSSASNPGHISNGQKLSVARCTHMQAHTRRCEGTRNVKPFAAGVRYYTASACFLFVSVLWDFFLCPTFISSSAALRSTRDKDRRVNQKQEEGWNQIYHKKSQFKKHYVYEGGHKGMEDGRLLVKLLLLSR